MSVRIVYDKDVIEESFKCERCGFSIKVRHGEIRGDVVGEHLKVCPGTRRKEGSDAAPLD